MGIDPTGSLNSVQARTKTPAPTPSADGKTGVFWTQFPAHAFTGPDGRPVDWADHQQAHRAVSRLFTPRLPGDSSERRARAGILHRVDRLGDDVTVLVQSLLAPELTPPNSRTTEVSARQWHMGVGEKVAFRLAVNPIRRTTTYPTGSVEPHLRRLPDGRRDRTGARQATSLVPMADMDQWIADRLAPALADLDIVSHYRDTSQSATKNGKHRIVIDTLDATATVADPAALDQIRVEGIGRAKSYGAGLLTLTRIG